MGGCAERVFAVGFLLLSLSKLMKPLRLFLLSAAYTWFRVGPILED